MGDVSSIALSVMLDDRRRMFETFDLIRELCPNATIAPASNAVPKLRKAASSQKTSSSQTDTRPACAPVEPTPQGSAPEKISEGAVKICVKIWLEARSLILPQIYAYSRFSQENPVQISSFPSRPLKRVEPFSL